MACAWRLLYTPNRLPNSRKLFMVLSGLWRFLRDVGRRGVGGSRRSAEIPPCKCGSKRGKGRLYGASRPGGIGASFPVHT